MRWSQNVDGTLDDPIWQQAIPITDFRQKEPYEGDVVNSYNDGPLADGGQLGPFYELESSSPAKELKPGEMLEHRHITLHLEGDEALLNEIAKKTLGVSLKAVSLVFP